MFERKLRILKVAMLLLVTALLVSMSSMILAESNGQWVPSTPSSSCSASAQSSGCGGDKVCSDWDVDGLVVMSCCISSEYLWTSVLDACAN